MTRATALLSLESAIFSVVLSSIHYTRFARVPVPQVAFCIVSGEPPVLLQKAALTSSLDSIKDTHLLFDSCNSTSPFWNLWVFLALPAIYAVWSTTLLIITLMAFSFTPGCIQCTVSDVTPLPLWLLVIVCTAVIPSMAIVWKVYRPIFVLECIPPGCKGPRHKPKGTTWPLYLPFPD